MNTINTINTTNLFNAVNFSIFTSDNFIPIIPQSYSIDVTPVNPGTKVYNYLEDATYETKEDIYVLTGLAGEQWPVKASKLESKYEFENGEAIIASELPSFVKTKIKTKASSSVVFARKAKKNEIVQTSYGATLVANRAGVPHGNGDYVVSSMDKNGCPNLEDCWIVNGIIFELTYAIYDAVTIDCSNINRVELNKELLMFQHSLYAGEETRRMFEEAVLTLATKGNDAFLELLEQQDHSGCSYQVFKQEASKLILNPVAKPRFYSF